MSAAGPKGCTHALIVKGEHFWCDEEAGHTGWPHGSVAAQTIWGDASEAAKVQPRSPRCDICSACHPYYPCRADCHICWPAAGVTS